VKITIIDFETTDENIVVRFNSKIGDGIATWISNTKPIKNQQYDVEIDIEKSVDQVWNTSNKNTEQYSISLEGDSILMNGMIESVEEDGMAYFRLSQDCLIMIEPGDSNVKGGDWVNLNLQHEDIEISAQENK
jgi:hypothetical protein